jgi:uncharacterized membrane protein YphA (DoxX/SURF4 family)
VFRASIAASLSIGGPIGWSSPLPFVLASALVLLGLSILLGFLTTLVSTFSLLVEIAVLILYPGTDEYHIAHLIVNCGVLAVLGPGAYSIDSILFGRRVLNIPRRH